MLILTRRVNEQIRIGTDITVTITKIAGQQVSVGIDAPRDVPVLRTELEAREPAAVGEPEPRK